MRIFSLINPESVFLGGGASTQRYKSVLVVGTWKERPCPKQAEAHTELGAPLEVEWSGDGEFGEIAWSYGGFDFICSTGIQSRLEQLGNHFAFEAVKFCVDHRSRPKYQFVWPIPHAAVSIDPMMNNLSERARCESCGQTQYEFKLTDLAIDKDRLGPSEVFWIPELGKFAPIFVTESYRERLAKLNLANLAFFHSGKVA